MPPQTPNVAPLQQPASPASMPSGPPPAPYQPSGPHIRPVEPKFLPLFEHDEDEVIISQINKHPIGLVFIWTGTILLFLLIIATTYAVLNFLATTNNSVSALRPVVTIVLGLLAFLVLVGGYIAAWVYRRSVFILTSEKLVQLQQKNLLNRSISQLSIGDIQDVTVFQKGILPRIFNYGSLVIETAGEQNNYTFQYVPYPHEFSKEIVGAHERNLKLYGN